MEPDALLAWIEKQAERVGGIHTCYEAGCFGFVLHRKLEALGVRNLVVRPRDWDPCFLSLKEQFTDDFNDQFEIRNL